MTGNKTTILVSVAAALTLVALTLPRASLAQTDGNTIRVDAEMNEQQQPKKKPAEEAKCSDLCDQLVVPMEKSCEKQQRPEMKSACKKKNKKMTDACYQSCKEKGKVDPQFMKAKLQGG